MNVWFLDRLTSRRTTEWGRNRLRSLLRLHRFQLADQLVQNRTQRARRERQRRVDIIVHAGCVPRGKSLLGGDAGIRR
jgi:hypothetical protein